MAKFTQIPANTFKEMQINAGIICTDFTPATGEIGESGQIGATTGGIKFTATSNFTDFGDDVDNCPKNTKELKRLEDVEVTLEGTLVTCNTTVAKMLMAAADIGSSDTTKITPRRDLALTDFNDIWFVGDYSDKNGATNGGFFAIKLLNALSTGGFSLQTSDKAKGQYGFVFTAHYSISAQTVVPYEVYIKAGTAEAGT